MKSLKITKIEKIEKKDRYDLTVPDTHNFFANGVLIHNTSGRTGRVKSTFFKYNKVKSKLNDFIWHIDATARKLSRKAKWLKFLKNVNTPTFELRPTSSKEEWEYVTGSRRVVIDPNTEYQGFYNGDPFREQIHQKIKDIGLQKGEVIYYEIVGFTDQNGPIM